MLGIPNIGGVFAKFGNDAVEDFLVGERLAAGFTIENSDGYAPNALARDAPIGTRGDHVGHALFAPGGKPFDLLDSFERVRTEVFAIHADEPLFGGAEDNGIVAAPAMWIAVIDLIGSGKSAVLFQKIDDDGVSLPNGLADELVGQRTRCAFGSEHATTGIDRAIDRKAVARADDKVVLAMTWGGMDGPGALFESDVFSVETKRIAIEKRVTKDHAIELGSREARKNGSVPTESLGNLIEQTFGNDGDAIGSIDRDVLIFRMEGDGKVRGNGPGSGGPYKDRDIAGAG